MSAARVTAKKKPTARRKPAATKTPAEAKKTPTSAKKLHPRVAMLRAAALAYPEAREEFPWGDRVVKVRGKIFVFMGTSDDGHFGCSLKLPESHALALTLPFASPTPYGLGKSGWVSLRGPELADAPDAMLLEWLEESYRAIAPAKLIAQRDAAAPAPKAPASKARRSAAPRRAAR